MRNFFMKTFVLIPLVVCLFVSGCNHSNQKIDNSSKPIVYPLLVDINNGFDNRKELPLSEIASEIEYVKLEFTEKSAISNLYNIHITDEYIFVKSYKVHYLMQFDRNGKFIRQIGTIGRGPKEYLLCIDFTVNETTKEIIIRDNWNHHLYFYDYDGVFQKKMNVSVYAVDIISLSTGEIVCSAGQNWGDPMSFMLLGYDNKGDTTFIKKSWFYKKNYQATAFYSSRIFSNNDSVFYNEFFGDTIYLYNSRSMIPYYILKWDKFKDLAVFNMTAYGRKEIFENYAKVFQPQLFQSTPGYLYIYYKYHFNNYLGRFNKRTRLHEKRLRWRYNCES
jgi:hypothetical protein